MEIAIISDTHLPKGRRQLPQTCVERLRAADVIIHAGDFSTVEVLREIRSYGPRVVAVHGNVDDAGVRAALPATAVVEADGARVAVVHDAGQRAGRLPRMRSRFPQAAAVVFGHSHLPLHETDPADGFQLINPGSPTERRRAPHHTMAVAHAGNGAITFELIELD